ncbi:MAG: DUF2062 domain-containing protein [Nitrospinae bacterium]|nr:DUF2062 domain-containing protein [Nitrospinota bacterium]
MPKKFIKKYFPSPESIRNHKSLQFLGNLLHDANLWHLNRKSVSGAFALGLFVAYVPVPFQMALAAIHAIIFRVNLPISVALVWITNPVTIPPMFYGAYKLGVYVLGVDIQPFNFELSFNWIFTQLGEKWQPFLLGCFLTGTVLALLGYILIQISWRLMVIRKKKKRSINLKQGIEEKKDDP